MIGVIIVYENVGEDTVVYYATPSEAEWEWVSRCHGKYVNEVGMSLTDTRLCERLIGWLKENGTRLESAESPFDTNGATKIVQTGFLL